MIPHDIQAIIATLQKAEDDSILCDCNCATICPLGRSGTELRCTAKELNDFMLSCEHLVVVK